MNNVVVILVSTGFTNENGTSVFLRLISFFNGQVYKSTVKAWVKAQKYTNEELKAMVGQVVMVDGSIPAVREGNENTSCQVWRIEPLLPMAKAMLKSEGLLPEQAGDDAPIPF